MPPEGEWGLPAQPPPIPPPPSQGVPNQPGSPNPYGMPPPGEGQYPYGQGSYGSGAPAQGPYGQNPYGWGAQGQVPYGRYPTPYGGVPVGPGVPVQPRKRLIGLVLGIVGGLVALALVGWYALDGLERSFPAARYKLTLPQSLVNGRFTLNRDISDQVQADVKQRDDDVRHAHFVAGSYLPGAHDPHSIDVLSLSGAYARIRSPARERTALLRGARRDPGATLLRSPREVPVPGAKVVVVCEVLRGASVVSTCAWADENTVAGVNEISHNWHDASDVDLAQVARDTLEVRKEVRKPL